MIVTVLLAFAVAIVAVIFALENPEIVGVTLFGTPIEGSVGLLLLAALGVGVLLGILLMLPSLIGRSITVVRHKRKISELEAKPREVKPKETKPAEVKPKDVTPPPPPAL